MNEITVRNENLPDAMEDLARFVLVGREKVTAVRAEIRAINKLHIAQEVREQKCQEVALLSEALLDAEVRLGELFKDIPQKKNNNPKGANQHSGGQLRSGAELTSKTKKEIVEDLGFSQDQSNRFEKLAKNQDIVEAVKAEARENGEIPTRARVLELAAYKNKQEPDGAFTETKIIDITDFEEKEEAGQNEYYEFLDLRVSVYKELSKVNELLNRFEINAHRMDALRDNFDAVLTVENEIRHINNSIEKLNSIKMEILKGKKYDKRKQ